MNPERQPDDIRPIDTKEVFPERDTRGQSITALTTFDMYYDPNERGPYNYTRDLQRFQSEPKNTWGGMTQRLTRRVLRFYPE